MTERLQEILNRKPSKWGNLTVKEFERDIKLLQERVEELERELEAVDRQDEQWKELIRTAMTWKNIYEKESKRFKQALEFYADRDNYKLEHFDPNLDDYMSTVDYDEGNTAREALEGEE